MSNIKTYINGMKEVISWFVGFQTKATVIIFKYKNFVWVNNMGDSDSFFIWYLLVLCSVCYSSFPVFLMSPFQIFSLRSTSESWILIFTSYSVLRPFFFPLGPCSTKSTSMAFFFFLRLITNNLCYLYLLTYVGNESLFYKMTVMNLIKIEQDPVRNK